MDWITPDVLVFAAGASFVAGYVIINQVLLRSLVMIGTFLYIWYYAVAAAEPLWGAIWASIAMGAANLFGLGLLFWSKSRLAIPRAHRDIYALFDNLPPGEFRMLMRAARRQRLAQGTPLTTEDEPVETVYFILEGQIHVQKFGRSFYLPEGLFVGETAFLRGDPSVATTSTASETEVLCWDAQDLRQRRDRNPKFALAIDAMITRDLAAKVSFAMPPAHIAMLWGKGDFPPCDPEEAGLKPPNPRGPRPTRARVAQG